MGTIYKGVEVNQYKIGDKVLVKGIKATVVKYKGRLGVQNDKGLILDLNNAKDNVRAL